MNSKPELMIAGPVTIIGGPSKFDLMLAMFDGRYISPRTVTFKLEGDDELTTSIDSVQAEDGSAESWNFKGKGCRKSNASEVVDVDGYFSTANRRGWLRHSVVRWSKTQRGA